MAHREGAGLDVGAPTCCDAGYGEMPRLAPYDTLTRIEIIDYSIVNDILAELKRRAGERATVVRALPA